MRYLFYSLVVFSVVFAYQFKYKKNVVFTIRPGDTMCFLKKVSRNKIIQVEYQVLDVGGNRSNQSISFDVIAPRGRRPQPATPHGPAGGPQDRAAASQLWPAGAHVLAAAARGVYRFCFDNSFDEHNNKTILMNLTIYGKKKKKLKKKMKSKKGKNKRKLKKLMKSKKLKEPLMWFMDEIDDSNIAIAPREKKKLNIASSPPSTTEKPNQTYKNNLLRYISENNQQQSPSSTEETNLTHTTVHPVEEENEKDKVINHEKGITKKKSSKQHRKTKKHNHTRPVTENSHNKISSKSTKETKQKNTSELSADETTETEQLTQAVKQDALKNTSPPAVDTDRPKIKTFSQHTYRHLSKKLLEPRKEAKIKAKPTREYARSDLEESVFGDDDDEEEELMFPDEENNLSNEETTEHVFVKPTTERKDHLYINHIMDQYDPLSPDETTEYSESRSTLWLPYRWDMID